MKDLYKPVFWCGFALSLSALYTSSDRFASGTEFTIRKPVLMQINIGDATTEEVDSQTIERNQFIAGDSFLNEPDVSEIPVPIETEDETPYNSPAEEGTSVFLSAAKDLLNKK